MRFFTFILLFQLSSALVIKRVTSGVATQASFIVSLEYDSVQHCAGVLIAPQIVLTAAHCTSNLDSTKWTAAFTDADITTPFARYSIQDIYIHPEFNQTSYSHDMALFFLSTPVTESTITTAFMDSTAAYSQPQQQVSLIGWGEKYNTQTKALESSNILEGTLMTLTDLQTCSTYYEQKQWIVDDSMQCMTGQGGSCNGDSGGPVYVIDGADTIVVGLVSWGLPGSCGISGDPSVNVNMYAMIPWVQAVCDSLKIVLPVRNAQQVSGANPVNGRDTTPSDTASVSESASADTPVENDTTNAPITETTAPLDERSDARGRDTRI